MYTIPLNTISNGNKRKLKDSLEQLRKPLNPIPPIIEPLPIDNYKRELLSKGWPLHAFDFPTEVISKIWVSGVGFTEDLPRWCYENGFTHVLNAAGSLARVQYYKTSPIQYGIKYLELDIDDYPKVELGPHLCKAYDFISEAMGIIDSPKISPISRSWEAKKDINVPTKILVHCVWGQSRSVACISHFIMKYWKIKYETALSLVRKARSCAKPNSGFDNQLRMMDFNNILL